MAGTFTVMLAGEPDPGLVALIRASIAPPRVVPMSALTALAQPAAQQPNLLVLDLREQTAIPPAVAQLRRQHPETGIVIVASKPDPDLMLSAMRAGVNECLFEPITEAAFEAAVTNVAARVAPAIAGQIFAFVGAKGGVGTTSLAVNVATALGQASASGALLIDLQIAQGDAAVYLGIESRFSVMDALENIHKLDAAYFRTLVTRGPGRLDLLAAPDSAGPRNIDAVPFRALLDFASKQFEYVIIDVPRTEPAVLDALDVVKSIIVITTQELPAVRAGTRLASWLRRRYGKERVQVVMSRQDKHADISEEDVERVLGGRVAHAFPSDYRLIMAALNKGRPVVLDNHSKLAASFTSFAHSLAGLERGGKSGSGWFGRLTGKK